MLHGVQDYMNHKNISNKPADKVSVKVILDMMVVLKEYWHNLHNKKVHEEVNNDPLPKLKQKKMEDLIKKCWRKIKLIKSQFFTY